MLNKSKMKHFLCLSLAVAGFVLVGGQSARTDAQVRDPFEQPSWKKPKALPKPGAVNGADKSSKTLTTIAPVMAPTIEQRIAYYKQLRESAAANGMPIPKVTSVLTLEEMSVTGIFRTSRGYAAMVEATPIKLSFTVYPGEKFFDGQLVAIEDNRLIIRKVVKMTNGKFVASVENKALRQFSLQQEVQGTVPQEIAPAKTEVAANTNPAAVDQTGVKPATPAAIVSPIDEMSRQTEEKPKNSVQDKNSKKNKKPVKVAKKS